METPIELEPPRHHDAPVSHVDPAVKAVLIAVCASLLALGGALVYAASTENEWAGAIPADVEEVIDDFTSAIERNDYAALQDVVSEDFRRPNYGVHSDGTGEYRQVHEVDDFDFLEMPAGLTYSIDTIGPAVVRGDGPWIIAIRQDWEPVGTGIRYEGIHTFVIVDRDGELRVEDAYWAGIGPVLVAG